MVKVGDKVLVIAGDDKGKEGTVTAVLKSKNKVVVSGVNIVTKHMKPNAMNQTGGIVKVEAPIHVSNVKVVTGEVKSNDKKVKEVKTEEKKTEKNTTKKTTKKSNKKESGEK